MLFGLWQCNVTLFFVTYMACTTRAGRFISNMTEASCETVNSRIGRTAVSIANSTWWTWRAVWPSWARLSLERWLYSSTRWHRASTRRERPQSAWLLSRPLFYLWPYAFWFVPERSTCPSGFLSKKRYQIIYKNCKTDIQTTIALLIIAWFGINNLKSQNLKIQTLKPGG